MNSLVLPSKPAMRASRQRLMVSLIWMLEPSLMNLKFSMLMLKCYIKKLWRVWLRRMMKLIKSIKSLEKTSLSFKKSIRNISLLIQRLEKMKRSLKLNSNTCREVMNQSLKDLIVFIHLIRILDLNFDMQEPQHPYNSRCQITNRCLLTLITRDQGSLLMNSIHLNKTMKVEWIFLWMTDQESLEFQQSQDRINHHSLQPFNMRKYLMILKMTTTSVHMNT